MNHLRGRLISASMHLADPPPIRSIVGIGKCMISPCLLRVAFYSSVKPLKAVEDMTINFFEVVLSKT